MEGDYDATSRTGNEAYYAFRTELHVKPISFNPDIRVIHNTFDQNVIPYITLLCSQCEYEERPNGRWLVIKVLKEYCLEHPKSTTQALCETFLIDWDKEVDTVMLYGDASGNKRDTRAAKSDYEIAKSVLWRKIGNNSMRVNKSNPEVRKSVLFLCAIFEGKVPLVELQIDKSCINLIQDLTYVKTDANGGILKEKATVNGVTYEKYGHTSDALRYFLTTLLKSEYRSFEKMLSGHNKDDE